jgi:hypothetical protein
MKAMKNFLLFAIIFANTAMAQDYIPFPLSNASWCDGIFFDGGGWPPPDTISTFYKTNGTILINDTTYTVIDRYDQENYCYLREEDKKVFCKYDLSYPEFVLYDFNIQTGDTVELPFENGLSTYTGIVAYQDSLLIGSVYHKRYYIDSWVGITLIEGVGSGDGLMYCEIPWVDWYGVLRCFSLNDTIYDLTGSGNQSTGNCWLYISITENDKEDIRVYPNPAQDLIFISGNKSYYLELYNALGELKIQTMASSLNLDGLVDGIYILNIYSQNKDFIKQVKIVRLDAH